MNRRIALLPLLAVLAAACDAGPAGTDRHQPAGQLALAGDAGPRLSAAGPVRPEDAQVFRFRSVEDADFPPDPAVCAEAGFPVNVHLGASLWSEASTANEGRVVNRAVRRIGRATACVRLTDFTFPEALAQSFYVRFDLPEGAVVARGACTITSNDVPTSGLVLAGCHLRTVEVPFGYAGGSVTSLSIFNPRNLAGFVTGSEWTVQLYPTARG